MVKDGFLSIHLVSSDSHRDPFTQATIKGSHFVIRQFNRDYIAQNY